MLAALQAQIDRKKRELQDSGVMEEGQTWYKRSKLNDVAQADEKELAHEVTSTDSEKASPTKDCSNDRDVGTELVRSEVIRKLRERSEPVRLFGETDNESFRRLRKLEILEPEINKGLRNDFQQAMSDVDSAYLQELLKFKGKDDLKDVKLAKAEVNMEDLIKMNELNVQKKAEKNPTDEMLKETMEGDCELVNQFVEMMLTQWGVKLNARTDQDKMCVMGKRHSATYNQTRCYLKPLNKLLRKRTLSIDILDSLVEIVQCCLCRNYLKATDSYLQMAIGNAPWPIGVTMVGIHSRTGREKIFSKHVAHVLNDETQRKFIQGLKRLITKCQEYYVTAPSRCVEYNTLEMSK